MDGRKMDRLENAKFTVKDLPNGQNSMLQDQGNMKIDLYYMPLSAPCRSVMLTANMLRVKLNLKYTDLHIREHLTPEFIKLNYQHCIPTLVDDGFVLWESRAIICYLADKYGQNDSLYPKDLKKRAVIHHRLFFDSGTLYQSFLDYYVPMMSVGAEPDPAKYKKLEEAHGFFDKCLEGQTWSAGDHITIADLALVSTVSSAEIFGFDVSKYPNVSRWLAKAKQTIPNYEELNHAGCVDYKNLFDSRTKK